MKKYKRKINKYIICKEKWLEKEKKGIITKEINGRKMDESKFKITRKKNENAWK